MKVHVGLPAGSKFRVPLLGWTFLAKEAMDAIAAHRPDLFTSDSDYRVDEIISGKLWLARLKKLELF